MTTAWQPRCIYNAKPEQWYARWGREGNYGGNDTTGKGFSSFEVGSKDSVVPGAEMGQAHVAPSGLNTA